MKFQNIPIYKWNGLASIEQEKLLARPFSSLSEEKLQIVKQIIQQVRHQKDASLIELTKKFDGVDLEQFLVNQAEFDRAYKIIDKKLMTAFKKAANNIKKFHLSQCKNVRQIQTAEGVFCQRRIKPLKKVGFYIPGGNAPLPSTLLMLAIPAQIAGCSEKIVCTPPQKNGEVDPCILAVANLCGIDAVFKLGGAQAIAAMAFGTETIPKVNKIFGPGNQWVTLAKLLVSQEADGAACDLPAGPSELLVIADETANPKFVAADLLSQAEHGVDSQVILISPSAEVIHKVNDELLKQVLKLSRQAILSESVKNIVFILSTDVYEAIEISNLYAPEHLSLQIAFPEKYFEDIENAGSIFVGNWTAEALGDYMTGANHVLPTNGFARSYSGLSLSDFTKAMNFQTVTEEGLRRIGAYAEMLANVEGLDGHKNAVTIRLNELNHVN